jgi:glycosyltransferase involved in cell wall biosynthesis
LLTNPIKLAVFIEPVIQAGGGHQQALNAALIVNKLPKNICQPVFVTPHKDNIPVLNEYGLQAVHLKISKFTKVFMQLKRWIIHPKIIMFVNLIWKMNHMEKFLDKLDINLLYFTSPSELPRFTDRFNFIYTVWDLSHRDEVEFPEIRENRVFERREKKYNAILPRATAILVDSKLGKTHVIQRYGIDSSRIIVMPFSPALGTNQLIKEYEKDYIDIKLKYKLDFDYIYYPAQLWAHKNHIYILESLKLLEQNYSIKIGAIFSGSDKGNLNYIKLVTENLGLTNRVIFAGFVSNSEIPFLYKQAIALVMPTYFGPTNLPPLEAFKLNVPVVYSDIPGAKNQLGEAALYCDLSDPISCVENLYKIYSDPLVKDKLVNDGRKVLSKLRDKDRIKVLSTILKSYNNKIKTWTINKD